MSFHWIFLNLMCLAAPVLVKMEPPPTGDFFPQQRANLSSITWAHAVNDAKYLQDVLQSDIMMIEADIVLGTIDGDDSGTFKPVMGHPPINHSDLSLEDFLTRINENNKKEGVVRKGVKLDFKSIEVFEESQELLRNMYEQVAYPFWLNADILPGPVDSQVTPVDAKRFLAAAKSFPSSELSIGWTTKYGGELTSGSYSVRQIDEMIAVLKDNGINQPVTFPLRAGILANSAEVVAKLLKSTEDLNSTITVWSSEGDHVDVPLLRDIIIETGLDRVYVDVPEDLASKLNL